MNTVTEYMGVGGGGYLLGMILGFVTDHFLSVFVINSVRNLYCVCCDSAIMSGEGGGLRQGERERQGLF